jgi:hypothetical protein
MWPEHSSVLANPYARHEHAYRAALSAITLLPGSPVRNAKHLLASLGASSHRQVRSDYFFVDLAETDSFLEAVCLPAEQLDDEGSPIDYDRRRRLAQSDLSDLLPADVWRSIGKADDLRATSHAFIQRYLFKRVTGLSSRTDANWAMSVKPFYDQYLRQMSRETQAELDAWALSVLATHGIHDEPVLCCPDLAPLLRVANLRPPLGAYEVADFGLRRPSAWGRRPLLASPAPSLSMCT